MDVEDVDQVAGLVAPGQGQRLVDGEVDLVEEIATQLVPDERQEAPRRIMGPIDPRRLPTRLVSSDDRPDEARLTQHELQRVSGVLQEITVPGERRGHALGATGLRSSG